MMDSLSSHCNDEIMKILGRYNILAFFYPSHTTNIFQALDLSLFGLVKKENQYIDEDLSEDILNDYIIKTMISYEKETIKFNIRGSFIKAGLTIDCKTNPRKIVFCPEKVIENKGFKEIWNFNIKMDEISERQKNKQFGILNIEYLPHYSNVMTIDEEKKQKIEVFMLSDLTSFIFFMIEFSPPINIIIL